MKRKLQGRYLQAATSAKRVIELASADGQCLEGLGRAAASLAAGREAGR